MWRADNQLFLRMCLPFLCISKKFSISKGKKLRDTSTSYFPLLIELYFLFSLSLQNLLWNDGNLIEMFITLHFVWRKNLDVNDKKLKSNSNKYSVSIDVLDEFYNYSSLKFLNNVTMTSLRYLARKNVLISCECHKTIFQITQI